MKLFLWSFLLLGICCFPTASAWDNDDLEIFDLVELINQDFYKLMGINRVSLKIERGIEILMEKKLILGCEFVGDQARVQIPLDRGSPRQKRRPRRRHSIQKFSFGLRSS